MLSRRGDMIGLFVLGPRPCVEPYSRDDKKLLASVAGQAGLALESLVLAEEMAEHHRTAEEFGRLAVGRNRDRPSWPRQARAYAQDTA